MIPRLDSSTPPMPPATLARLAGTPRPTTIDDVIERLLAIEAALPARHGVAAFTRLYRWTTENVGLAVRAGRFESPDQMVTLDVRFADLYFDAVDAWALGEPIPGAWAPLFERAEDLDLAPLRFALAGMHAHINRDLAVAVALSDPAPPEEDTPRFRDYRLLNAILDETSDQVRHRLLPPDLEEIDAALGEVDDRVVLAAIATARRGAWEAAQLLYAVREHPLALRAAVDVLDGAVGAGARLLLFQPELPVLGGYREHLLGVSPAAVPAS
ncbi:MAG: DUF5995 family protein [Myxococcota bacterium]